MIVRRKNEPWLRLLVTFHGSSLEKTWRRITAATAVSIGVTLLSLHYRMDQYTFTTAPFTLIGVALGIFLGFRNNASYDRFWEGRKLWGALVNTCRTLARQAESLPDISEREQFEITQFRERFIRRVIAFAHSLRLHLRDEDNPEQFQHMLDVDEFESTVASKHRPVAIMTALGRDVQQAKQHGWLDAMSVHAIDRQLAELSNIMGGCERIKNTPIPFPYAVLIHRLVAFYCFALPFGLVDTVHYLTPIVVFLVSHAFFGLDAIGDEIENPFDHDANSLPLRAICQTIEINLLEQLGESDLPKPAIPVGFILD
ncbi:MAG: hypothetical protein IT422_04095 [Pirellulaceae bacterium]|jgi:putative membrane protein|nr:hypothetical protein [Pirellulaceae bacterium]